LALKTNHTESGELKNKHMKDYLSLVKFSHTIFAMPFAITGCFLGLHLSESQFSGLLFVKIVLAMIFARTAAMAFNRFADRDIDIVNPRTSSREIPAGIIKPSSALVFVLLSCVLFVFVSFTINKVCFYLSPVALFVVLGYSYAKRFTALCHFILGLGLSLAPIGAFLAVTGYFHDFPVLIGVAVLLWVSGFDIIYALQDASFDSKNNLHSVPVLMGEQMSLWLSRSVHLLAGLILLYIVYLLSVDGETFSVYIWVGAIIFNIMLIYQHLIISRFGLSRVDLAFFTTNGIASIFFGLFFVLDFFF
jgi:4-hydroxybenzoate polyprenyltransferase